MKRIVTATVRNQSGVLNRITGVMSRRQFNIESISVGHTESPHVSRMTIVVHVDSLEQMEQLIKQLHKQIDVLKVSDITEEAMIARELALIKVSTSVATRAELYSLIDPFRATVIDVGKDSIIVQVTGTQDKIEALIELLRPYGLKEIARTGVTAFTRSMKKQEKPQKMIINGQ
ncbi:acetolactate synthase small subunit [Ectobacillus ponti]|uniref:Acetolactate synthase small subunit n=1 Tax=Ectobacillus ponti TaxID=2961894 RepID=A0AA41X4L4_9BACI|nr:acetolactate synthase small subunit [Ectobacillus ponti]MCP8968642.1 acetolactate synthase small subunit [Ectobacillus ponti]